MTTWQDWDVHPLLPAFQEVWTLASQQTREQWYVALTELTWPDDCPLAAPPELAHEVRREPRTRGEALAQAMASMCHPFVIFARQRLTAAEKDHALSIYYGHHREEDWREWWSHYRNRWLSMELCSFQPCDRRGDFRGQIPWTCLRCDPAPTTGRPCTGEALST